MLDLTEMDPFTNVTIASVCMAVYRNLFLEEQWVVKMPGGTEVPETKINSCFEPNIQGRQNYHHQLQKFPPAVIREGTTLVKILFRG